MSVSDRPADRRPSGREDTEPPGTPGAVPAVGDSIGPYRVLEEIGGGRSGVVFRVRHQAFRTNYVMKVLRRRDRAVEQRLRVEVQAQQRLRHPNAVPFGAVIETAETFALLIDPTEGPSLRELLVEGKRMPADDVMPMFAEMLAGVNAAHRVGVLHLGLTPDLVHLVPHEDRVFARVTDFGLAGALQRLPAADSGGARYIAPELVRDAGNGSTASDIFSLGVLLYEMLAGVPPFWGAARGPGRDGLPVDIKPVDRLVPECPPLVPAALARALQMDPDRRFPDCESFARALFGEDFVLFDEGDVGDAEQFDPRPEPTLPRPAARPALGVLHTDPGELDLDPDSQPVAPFLPPPRPVKPVVRSRKGSAANDTTTGPTEETPALDPAHLEALPVVEPAVAPVRSRSKVATTREPEAKPTTPAVEPTVAPSISTVRAARMVFQYVVAPVVLLVGVVGAQAAWSGYKLGQARADVEVAAAQVDAKLAEGLADVTSLAVLTAGTPAVQTAVDRSRSARTLDERVDALRALQAALRLELQAVPSGGEPASELERRRLAKSVDGLTAAVDRGVQAQAALEGAEGAPLVNVGVSLGFADGRPFGQDLPFLRPAPTQLATVEEE